MAVKVKLSNVRLSFPTLFTAEQYKGQGAFNYSAKFMVKPGSPNDGLIKDAILAVAKEKWPKKVDLMLEEFRMDKKAYPYIDGKRVEFDGAEGMWVLTAKRKQDAGRPLVVDADKTPLAESDGKPYAGCFVNASVEFWAQDGDTKGIRCSLIGVQFAKDGEHFGGGARPSEDDFEDISEGASADDLV